MPEPTPSDCYWIQSAPCGCLVSLTVTTTAKGELRTAEEAHKRLVPSKRERDEDIRNGLTWALVPKASYHESMAAQWECVKHKRPAA
ncbi:hypothetical protein [Streptomyces sp. NRRL F-5135]|uniref:hypothetical protein n=1 Tax=Streptomyces sp. NRRL F-5135 TaxID=1463858 RepID=UPI0004CC368F|nr:hypothetical protein [Streptomyces sp. NRRL F-5135]